MSYHRTSLGQIPFHQSGGSPWGMPMPIQAPGPGLPGPTMPTSIYPRTSLRWGDPVSITGPFAGSGQGHVRVKFAGAPAIAPAILGPFQASVQVPEGSQTGECWVEIDGRRTFGGLCSIVPARSPGVRRPGVEEWRDFGPKGMSGLLPESPAARLFYAGATAAGAYHGYKRNSTVGSAVLWAVLSSLAPFIAIPVAVAQGFAKPRSR